MTNKSISIPEIDEDVVGLYVKVFSTSAGLRVLADMERRAYHHIRINEPLNKNRSADFPNPAYMNKNAALYRSALLDQVQMIRRYLKGRGAPYEVPTDENDGPIIEDN